MRANLEVIDKNVTIVRGDTLSFAIMCNDQNGELIPINEAIFSCKKNPDNEEYVFQKTLGDGITRVDDHYVVRVSPQDTEEVDVGFYWYDLRIGVGDDTFTIMKGILGLESNIGGILGVPTSIEEQGN